jgi:4-amino-4-deoxy-L-arabinose transferase-like glycosyltransferase
MISSSRHFTVLRWQRKIQTATLRAMSSWLDKLAARPQRSIILLSLLLLLAGNWILPLTDRDEARFGEASREMIQRGDYIVPWFNGNWRFDKPVLIYWCQIASYRVLGDNDFAARLPTVLFTTGIALLLVRWGKKISGDNKTGFFAGAMFVTCLHVAIIMGRIATADMAMIFFVTLAAWSGWELTRPENPERRKWWWIFYVSLAFGFLAKGPVAWLPLGGMILGRALRKNSFRLPLNETIVGLCVAMALVALWGGPALIQTDGQFWTVGMGEHVINRSVGVINGHGPKDTLQYLALLPMYFVTFFVSFLPWSLRVPGTLRRWWPTRKRDDLGWYLLVNIAVVFIAFSLVKTKLPHYTMPAFPLIALWLALQISSETQIGSWFSKRLAVMVFLVLTVTLGVFSFARSHLLTLNLWNTTKPYVKAETKIGCFGYVEPSLVWRFRAVTTNFVTLGSATKAADFLTNSPPFILVLPTDTLTNLPDTNGIIFSIEGLDLVKFQNRKLTAIVRQ